MLTIGRTLAFYFARRFALMVLAIFLFFVAADRRHHLSRIPHPLDSRPTSSTRCRFSSSPSFRVPSICEDVLPFTILFGSIAAFVIANRRLEVVVARAAGVSAWQFLLPACIVGLLIGVISTTLYNPASTALRGWADEIQAQLLSLGAAGRRPSRAVRSGCGRPRNGRESIIGALQSFDHGLALVGVTAFVFDEDGQLPGAGRRTDRRIIRGGRVAVRERHHHGAEPRSEIRARSTTWRPTLTPRTGSANI